MFAWPAVHDSITYCLEWIISWGLEKQGAVKGYMSDRNERYEVREDEDNRKKGKMGLYYSFGS